MSTALSIQKAWGDALVAISTTSESRGIEAARALAEEIIDSAYGYQDGAVLFKPTLTMHPQTFRITPPCPILLKALPLIGTPYRRARLLVPIFRSWEPARGWRLV